MAYTIEQLRTMGATPLSGSPAAPTAPTTGPKRAYNLQELQGLGAQPVTSVAPSFTPQPAAPPAPAPGSHAMLSGIEKVPGFGLAAELVKPFAAKGQAEAQMDVNKNRKTLADEAMKLIQIAGQETDPIKKKGLLAQANRNLQTGDVLRGQVEKISSETPQYGPLSRDLGRIAGRSLETVATFGGSALGAAGAGTLLGAGSAISEGKPILPTSMGDFGNSVVGRAATYGLTGKVLGYGLEKAVGTQIGHNILTSRPVQAVGGLLQATQAKPSAPGTTGEIVDKAFKAFGTYADKFYSPSTYLKPVGKLGQEVGILRTPEQKVEAAQKRITNYWENTKSRYAAAVKYDENSPAVLGREGIIPDAHGGAMHTQDQELLVRMKASAEHETLDHLLDSSGGYGSLKNVEKNMIQNVNKNYQGVDRSAALRYFKSELNAFAQQNADVAIEKGGDTLLPLRRMNDLKSYLWSKGYPSALTQPSEALRLETARLMGNSFKQEIETAAAGVEGTGSREAIINLNKRLGDLYESARFLHAMDGKKLPFGLIGRHFARLTGAVIGAHAGVAGSITGAITADRIANALADPNFHVGAAAALIKRANIEAPEAVIAAQKIIDQNLQNQATRLRLPPPSALGSPGNPIMTPPPTIMDKSVPQTVKGSFIKDVEDDITGRGGFLNLGAKVGGGKPTANKIGEVAFNAQLQHFHNNPQLYAARGEKGVPFQEFEDIAEDAVAKYLGKSVNALTEAEREIILKSSILPLQGQYFPNSYYGRLYNLEAKGISHAAAIRQVAGLPEKLVEPVLFSHAKATFAPINEIRFPSGSNLDSFVDEALKKGIINFTDVSEAPRSLVELIKKYGIRAIPPIVVDRSGSIIDGVHRFDALRELGHTNIPVIIKNLTT